MNRIKKQFWVITICLLLFATFSFSQASADQVQKVYICGQAVMIELVDIGWVVALESQVGVKNADRIYAAALTAFTTGADVVFTNPSEPISHCGSTARPITAFMISK